MSAKHKGTFFGQYPGKEVHSDVLNNFIKEGVTSCASFAMAGTNNNIHQVMVHRANLRDNDVDVPTVLKSFSKTNVITYAGIYPDQFNEEDIQPFELFKNPQGKTAAVLFLDGMFPNFNQPQSTHSEEFFAATTYLMEKFNKIYNDCGQDINKFYEHINTNNILKMEMDNLGGGIHPMSMVILTQHDKIKSFGKLKDYDWGWMSATGAASEPEPVVVQPEPVAEPKTGTMDFSGFKKKTTEKPVTNVAATPATDSNKHATQVTEVAQPTTATAIPTAKGPNVESMVTIYPPPWCNSNTKLSEFYDRKGSRPSNWKERPPIVVPMRTLSTKEIEWVTSGMPGLDQKEGSPATNIVTGTSSIVPVADKTPPAKTEVAPSSEMVAVQKIIGAAGELPKNPLDIQEEGEPKWDSWADTLKKDGVLITGLEAMFNWSDTLLLDHIKNCPELTLALIKDLRRLVILDYKTKPVAEPQQTPQAADSGGFSFFNKKKATG